MQTVIVDLFVLQVDLFVQSSGPFLDLLVDLSLTGGGFFRAQRTPLATALKYLYLLGSEISQTVLECGRIL